MGQKSEQPSREGVTSDPDRGIPVNSGTDPTRPGTPAKKPTAEPDSPGTSAPETSISGGDIPVPAERDNVERSSGGSTSDVERS